MTELLCLKDAYLKECHASVVNVEGNKVELDKTVFYPQGGGQPTDKGKIIYNGKEFAVEKVLKENGIVWHYCGEALKAGDAVHLAIDWERRFKLMRMHTAAHVLGSVAFKKGVLVTGNQLDVDQTRFDFSFGTGLHKEALEESVAEANELLKGNVEVKTYELPREEALKLPGIIKLADKLPPNIDVLRIVEIPGIDLQADGGTHVKNLKEIGTIKIEKIENKGSKNKRLYYSLE